METPVWLLLQAMAHNLAQRRGHGFRQFRRVLAQNGGHQLHARGPFEGRPPGQTFVQHQAEAEDIAACVHRFAAHLFRRHVTRSPEHRARHRAREQLGLIAARSAPRHLFGQSEIEDLGAPVARQHDVLRLEIAVYDCPSVRCRQRIGHLSGDLHHAALRQSAAFQQVAQSLAFDQFADNVDQPILAADIVNRNNIRMIQRAGGAGLLFEALAAPRVVRHVRGEHLKSHSAAKACVECAIHLAHAARPQEGSDLVRPDPAARG